MQHTSCNTHLCMHACIGKLHAYTCTHKSAIHTPPNWKHAKRQLHTTQHNTSYSIAQCTQTYMQTYMQAWIYISFMHTPSYPSYPATPATPDTRYPML